MMGLSRMHNYAKLQRAALFVVLAAYGVVAQDSNVQTCIAGLEWLVNSRAQSPCLLSSYLQSTCSLTRVDAIPAGTHYLGPQSPAEANECLCSTVVYSLRSACGACQGRNWASWTRWSTNCPPELTSYGEPFPRPIPPAAQLPTWAYMDVRAQINSSWNPQLAFAMGSQPLTTSGSNPTPSPTDTFNPPPASSSSATKSSNTGAIAGGVVGGVVFLVAVGLLVFWFILRKRKTQVPKDFEVDGKATNATSPAGTSHARSASEVAPMMGTFSPSGGSSTLPSVYEQTPFALPASPPSYYQDRPLDMSDTGSAMPMSPSSAVYTTLPSRRSFESQTQPPPSQYGSLVSAPHAAGRYTGAAEPA